MKLREEMISWGILEKLGVPTSSSTSSPLVVQSPPDHWLGKSAGDRRGRTASGGIFGENG
jgi:hypothetical protein